MGGLYLIEDSRPLRKMIREAAEAGGLAVVGECDTQSEALDGIAAARPAIVSLDLRLRDGTGWGVLSARFPQSPQFVIFSGIVTPRIRQLSLERGASACFHKADLDKYLEWLRATNGAA